MADPVQQPSPPPLWLAPSSSLVPIETNGFSSTADIMEKRARRDDCPQPPVSGTKSHSMDGRYTMVLPTTEEIALRHSCWAQRRRQIRESLGCVTHSRNRLNAWDSCGSQALLHWHKSGQWVLCQAFHCHDRFCYPCSKSRTRVIAENISRKIAQSGVRFITLTLTSDRTPLTKQIDRLYRCFKTLRSDDWWTNNVSGGAAFLEVTFNPLLKMWHPHLHPIVQGQYLPQDVLSRKWLAITGNSPIVHIKYIPAANTIANYVAKYAAKGMDDSVFSDPEKLQEWLIASCGRRLCMTTGNWRGWKLTETTPLDMSEFRPVGSLTHVTQQAALGEKWAIDTLNALRRNLRWEALNPDAYDDANPFT